MSFPKEIAIFAGGCFWCTEAIFQQLNGVLSVTPGYTGGRVENPSYEQVSSGITGHAEATRIEFDPSIISFNKLMEVFFATHDPTSLNRQGNDEGEQYRSSIFFTAYEQKKSAEEYIATLSAARAYTRPIVTTIEPFTVFYEAEDYHRQYFEHHKDQPYCQLVIAPKIRKVQDEYHNILKKPLKK